MNSIIWTALTTLFGLLQLVVVFLISIFDSDRSFDVWKLAHDYSILFFCTALVSSIAIDFFCRKNRKYNLPYVGAIYVLFPIFILIGSVTLYCVGYLGAPDDKAVLITQSILFVMTITYAYSTRLLATTK